MTRILIIPDWHWREIDFQSVIGYVDNIEVVAKEIMQVIVSNDIDTIVFLGDLFDGGYSDVSVYQSHVNLLEEMVSLVKGRAYLNIGNHYFKHKKSNPEVYLTQPCGIMSTEYSPNKKFIPRDKPLLRVVDNLLLDGVQLAFHHFSDLDKEYTTSKMIGADFVVGFYHDECTLPHSILSKLHMEEGSANSGYLTYIYENVQIAIHGHIHVTFPLSMYGHTAIIVPGALAPTQNSDGYIHPSIDLPILTCLEGRCTYSYVTVDTHLENLKFTKCRENATTKQVNEIRKAAREMQEVSRFCTIGEYIDKRGYNSYYKKMFALAMKEELSIPKVYSIVNEKATDVIEV